jgi:hypothetical protein
MWYIRIKLYFIPVMIFRLDDSSTFTSLIHFILLIHIIFYIISIILSFNTGCPRRNVPDFGKVFLMVKYTDITQNTDVQNWTVTEIMAREMCGLLARPCTVAISWHVKVSNFFGQYIHNRSTLDMGVLGYIGILYRKEQPPEVCHIPPGTPV